jgi:uncharacterized LabA/DUF88 family protein
MHNVAIFYDIENLVKGYNQSQMLTNDISLKGIFNRIKEIGQVNDIAIQRAYANWSDPRLSIMTREINELGIDPIQIFGLSRNQKKNAADIQLAVDAIDLAYTRPWLDVFVIVSGDGGFSALAKKLHECGRKVIGCAYKSSTNQIFASVCDIFIGIEEPQVEASTKTPKIPHELTSSLKITNHKILRMSQSIPRLASQDIQEILEKSSTIIDWFINDEESLRELKNQGIHLSVIKEAFKYGIENFDTSLTGFSKFTQFLQFVCSETPLKVVSSQKNEVKMVVRYNNLIGFEDLPDIKQNYLQSVENYQTILESGNTLPRFRLVSMQVIRSVVSLVNALQSEPKNINSLLEYLEENHINIERDLVNRALVNLISSQIFMEQNLEGHFSEVLLIVKSEYQDIEEIISKIIGDMSSKLKGFLGESFREEIFQDLLINIL